MMRAASLTLFSASTCIFDASSPDHIVVCCVLCAVRYRVLFCWRRAAQVGNMLLIGGAEPECDPMHWVEGDSRDPDCHHPYRHLNTQLTEQWTNQACDHAVIYHCC